MKWGDEIKVRIIHDDGHVVFCYHVQYRWGKRCVRLGCSSPCWRICFSVKRWWEDQAPRLHELLSNAWHTCSSQSKCGKDMREKWNAWYETNPLHCIHWWRKRSTLHTYHRVQMKRETPVMSLSCRNKDGNPNIPFLLLLGYSNQLSVALQLGANTY